MNRQRRSISIPHQAWVLTALLALFAAPAHAGRAFIVNLLEYDAVEVSLAAGGQSYRQQVFSGESTGYLPLSGSRVVLRASRSGSLLAEAQVELPANSDWTFALARTPDGHLEWATLADHNHLFATFTVQAAHLSSNAGELTFATNCRTALAAGRGSTTASYGYGVNDGGGSSPTLSKPLPGPGQIPITCDFSATSADGTLIARSQAFDSAVDSGNVYRVFLADDGAGGSRFLTFFQETRGTTPHVVPAPTDSGLFFSPQFAGAGWALVAEQSTMAAMYFGFDDEGQPIWFSSRRVEPRSDGSPTHVILEQYQRQPTGLLTRVSLPAAVDLAVHGCDQLTVFSHSHPQSSQSVVPGLAIYPQNALTLDSIHGEECVQGELQ